MASPVLTAEISAVTSERGTSDYNVCVYHSGLREPLGRFIEKIWPNDRAADSGKVPGLGSKGGKQDAPIFLFMKGQEVIGHIATLPVRLYSQSGVHPAHWVVGFMVLPEYRNGIIGPLLIKKINETLDFALTLHVEEAPLRIFRGLGWKYGGIIPQYVLPIKPYSFLRNLNLAGLSFVQRKDKSPVALLSRLLSWPLTRSVSCFALAGALRLLSSAASLRRPALDSGTVREESEFDAAYDALWQRVAHKYGVLVVRDRRYLQTRYGERNGLYRILAYRERGELIAYCVMKVKQFSDDSRVGCMKVGTVVDCLFDPDKTGALQSLFGAVIRLCAQETVDAVFCTASFPPLQRILSLNGFIKTPGNLNFAYLDTKNNLPSHSSLDMWHLMRGDSDADANF